MNKFLLPIMILLAGCAAKSPEKINSKTEETAIRELLSKQEVAWNEGNIDSFMEGYWKSDSLMFIGNPIAYGWNATIARYKKSYPDTQAMGKLDFTLYKFNFISNDACVVTGKYHLKRISDDPTGMFTLVLRKMNGRWLIVYDHTS